MVDRVKVSIMKSLVGFPGSWYVDAPPAKDVKEPLGFEVLKIICVS